MGGTMFKLTQRHNSTKQGGMAQIGSSAVSGVAVIALIGVLLLMFGQRADHVAELETIQAGSVQPVAAQGVDAAAVAPIPVAPGPDAAPGMGPDDHMGAVPGPIVPRGSVPEPTAERADPLGSFTEAQVAAAPRGAVVIFNQTYKPSLADGLKRELVAGGWTVSAVDRWNGAVPLTTVYYPKGMELQARALMAAFPSIGRIKPAFGGIPTDKLTVIICKDMPALGSAAPSVVPPPPAPTGTAP